MTGIELIAQERQEQIDKLNYSLEHDMQHSDGELIRAAKAYLNPFDLTDTISRVDLNDYDPEDIARLKKENIEFPVDWPFDPSEWHGEDDTRITQLAKAGALIAAEIDRLQSKQP